MHSVFYGKSGVTMRRLTRADLKFQGSVVVLQRTWEARGVVEAVAGQAGELLGPGRSSPPAGCRSPCGRQGRPNAGSRSPRPGAAELGWARADPHRARWNAGCCSPRPSLSASTSVVVALRAMELALERGPPAAPYPTCGGAPGGGGRAPPPPPTDPHHL
jgi:hypothetical protein